LDFDWDLLINSGCAGGSAGAAATHNIWLDTVRGVAADKMLTSNTNGAEGVEDGASYGYLTSATGGFNLVSGSHGTYPWVQMNYSGGYKFINWCWNKSATAGFDIVSYTGNGTSGKTVPHGLNTVPDVIIVKRRDATASWQVYHSSLGPTKFCDISSAQYVETSTNRWNDTAPTSSVFTLGDNSNVNSNTNTYIAYLWSAVAGYSSFGQYDGNGGTDGNMVYTGFKPAWVMVKHSHTSGSEQWQVFDNVRDTENVNTHVLPMSLSQAETTDDGDRYMDFLSNGFKLRGGDGSTNDGSYPYIYMAFADQPFKYANAE